MLKELASDSQMYCLSSLCFEVTTTRSATVGKRKIRRNEQILQNCQFYPRKPNKNQHRTGQ